MTNPTKKRILVVDEDARWRVFLKVLITSPANWRIVRQAFRLGAFDHLPKTLDEGGGVLYRVEQALAVRRPI